MKRSVLAHQLRAFLVTILAGLAFTALAVLVLHYGLSATATSAENQELKGQIRTLVEQLAAVEGELHHLDQQRQSLDDMTLAAVSAVLGTTTLDPQAEGKVYLASLSAEQRLGTSPLAPLPGAAAEAAAAGDTPADDSFPAMLTHLAAVKQQARDLLRTMQSTAHTVGLRQEVLGAIPSRVPAKGWISSGFGLRVSPFHGTGEHMHYGIDLAADEGTPVYATADGEVQFAGLNGSFGKYIRISHGFGITTRYAHNGELKVKRGQKVHRGDQIAVIGVTGRTTGPHVHYEVLVHDRPVDPARFFFASTPVPAPPVLGLVGPLRPMGGDAAADDPSVDLLIDGAGPVAKTASAPRAGGLAQLLSALTGEPLVFAAALPRPLSQATTSDLMLLAAVLMMFAVASSLTGLRVGFAGQAREWRPRARTEARRFDWGIWAGSEDDGSEDDDAL